MRAVYAELILYDIDNECTIGIDLSRHRFSGLSSA